MTEGHRVGVTLVKAAVAEWKRPRREVFVPLTYRPGDLAEVDFFEVLVDLDGPRRKAGPRALVRCEGAVDSVPCRWAGLDLITRVGATTVTIVGRDGTRIGHGRKRFGQRSIDDRHYLPELARNPQAVRQVLPELLRDLGAPFPAVWEHFQTAHTPREAARRFAKVLGQLDTHGADSVVPAIDAARRAGTPLLLALTPGPAALAQLTPDARPVALRDVDVPSGCAADYDGWLAEAV